MVDGHLLIGLHACPEKGAKNRAGRVFWRSPAGVWTGSITEPSIVSLEVHLAEYEKAAVAYEEREDRCANAKQYFDLIEELAPFARASKNMYETLEEARQLCGDDLKIIDYRDSAYQTARIADLTYLAAKDGLEYSTAKKAEEEAETSKSMAKAAHRLNALLALFFPLATLMAVFGTNLEHGFERVAPPIPLICVVALGLLLGMITWRVVGRSQKS